MPQAKFYTSTDDEVYIRVFNMGDLTDYPSTSPVEMDLVQSTSNFSWKGDYMTTTASTIDPGDEDALSEYIDDFPLYGTEDHDAWVAHSTVLDLPEYGFLANTSGAAYNIARLQKYQGFPSKIWLASAFISGNRYLGFYIEGNSNNGRGWSFMYNTRPLDSVNILFNELEIDSAPGDKGFKPAGMPIHGPRGGGNKPGFKVKYPTDTLTQPEAPDESVASAVGTGFINIYSLNTANLNRLGKCLFDGLLAKLNNIFMSPMDSIISLQVFPCSPNVGSSEAIKILKYTCISEDLGADAVGNRLASQFKVFDFGTLSIAEMWESFLDYDATAFTLYLPFIGAVDLPVSDVMGGSVNVRYTVDFITGMCVANVLCTKKIVFDNKNSANQYSQHSYMGNCSVQIPLNSVSYGNIIGSLAQAASAGLRSGIVGAAGSLAMSALSGGLKPIVETKGTINANAGFCSILQPYITITRPITAEPDGYQEVMGYPSYCENTLGACSDLCVCDNIDLSGLSGATDSEMDRIRQMCKDGVYV